MAVAISSLNLLFPTRARPLRSALEFPPRAIIPFQFIGSHEQTERPECGLLPNIYRKVPGVRGNERSESQRPADAAVFAGRSERELSFRYGLEMDG